MTTDINTVADEHATTRAQSHEEDSRSAPRLGSASACDNGQSHLPESHSNGGAEVSQPAPPPSNKASSRIATSNLSRKAKRRARVLPLSLVDARLHELFWREPDLDYLAEIEQRIASVLNGALATEPIQLFDDVYERAAC